MTTEEQAASWPSPGSLPCPLSPESVRPAVEQLIARRPDVMYVGPADGGFDGFKYGGGRDDGIVGAACTITTTSRFPDFVLAVIDGQTMKPLHWPALHTVTGQPCHSKDAIASAS